MDKRLVTLGLCVLAAGCTETRVVHDNSVAAQFMRYNGRSGCRVTVGDASPEQKPNAGPSASTPNGANGQAPNPFGNAVWRVNFQVVNPSPAGAAPTPPQAPAAWPLPGEAQPPADAPAKQ